MIIYCEAIVENTIQQENLIECIEILGATPKVKRDKISVDYKGKKSECDAIMSLFEHFPRHNITIID